MKVTQLFVEQMKKIYKNYNGNFLCIVQLIVEFDSVMKPNFFHYLSHKTQNELIEMLTSQVKNAFIKKLKNTKYFYIFLDCILDAGHKKHMSLTKRCVNVASVPIKWGFFSRVLSYRRYI